MVVSKSYHARRRGVRGVGGEGARTLTPRTYGMCRWVLYVFCVSRAASSPRSLRRTLPRYSVPLYCLFLVSLYRVDVVCFQRKYERADGLGGAFPRAVAMYAATHGQRNTFWFQKTDRPILVVGRCCCPPAQPTEQRFAPKTAR